MWQPEYDRDGHPFTADEPSSLTPAGRLEAGRRFLVGLRGSPRQRRAAWIMLTVVVLLVAVVIAVASVA